MAKMKRFRDLQARVRTPAEIAESNRAAEGIVLEMNLRALRERLHKTQAEMALLVEKTQPELSQIENRGDHLLSTLRAYVKALGGELEVRAVFNDDTTVRLTGV
jgi:DNA-binding XRE family transcriptional regulator